MIMLSSTYALFVLMHACKENRILLFDIAES